MMENVGFKALRRPISWLITRRFGSYQQSYNQVDSTLPKRVSGQHSVVVIGAGIAGLTSAALLAERGYAVTLFDKNDYLGGKIGGWNATLPSGRDVSIDHGFHAFFRHYYNLNRFLQHIGAPQMRAIEDYQILTQEGSALRFAELETTPLLNIFHMSTKGVFRWRDLLTPAIVRRMLPVLRYDPVHTPAEFDELSFEDWAVSCSLPPKLRLAFNTFARAFFASEDRMSMGELIKSFHFYYLGHDLGLMYDYPEDSYQRAVLEPLCAFLDKHGVTQRLGEGVTSLTRDEAGGFVVNGVACERIVVAADVVGTRTILSQCEFIQQHYPKLHAQVDQLRPSQGYAVLRLWLDRAVREDIPVFVITERNPALDSVTQCHRIDPDSRSWAEACSGSVIELHCYAHPDGMSEEDLHAALLKELTDYFPELDGVQIVDEYFQVRCDFTALHVGMHASRPEVITEVPGLYLAGDWVKLPLPAMLMEAACTGGLLAANEILKGHGLQEEPVLSVPPRGLLTMPRRSS